MVKMKVHGLIFFDRPAIKRAVNKAQRSVLSRAGAFIRQTAKTSLRKRKGTAPPGGAPYSHTGLLRKFLLFGYDPRSESVVVGPGKLAKPGSAPHTLEYGGTTRATRNMVFHSGPVGRGAKGEFTKGKRRWIKKGTIMKVAARPFMGPAMAKELPNFPSLWRNSIRSG